MDRNTARQCDEHLVIMVMDGLNAAVEGDSATLNTIRGKLQAEVARGTCPREFLDVIEAGLLKRQNRNEEARALHEATLPCLNDHNLSGILIFSYNNLAMIARDKNDFAQAVHWYKLAIDRFDEDTHPVMKAAVYNNYGNNLSSMCEFDKALEYCLMALKIREEMDIRPGVASCHLNMSEIFTRMNDFENAVLSSNKAAAIYENLGMELQLSKVLNIIGIIHMDSGHPELAIEPLMKSLAIKEKHGRKDLVHNTLYALGKAFFKLGDLTVSRRYYTDALNIRRELGDRESVTTALMALGDIETSESNDPSALEYYRMAEENGTNRKDSLLALFGDIASTSARLGDFEKAYRYIRESFELNNEIFQEERAKKIAELEARFETDKKQKEAEIYRLKNVELQEKNRMIEEQKAEIERTLNELRRSERSLTYISEKLNEVSGRKIIGESPEIKAVLNLTAKVAQTDNTTVLIIGESGTGKELIARAIHDSSRRSKHFFHAVNSSAISGTLFESEFFGHEKGAFTGALQTKPGWFEVANGGTLFLDEIGYMPMDQQIKLLRVLEERNIIRVGARNEISVNVRIISATNQNLSNLVEQGVFRSDLYHRLAAFVIKIPPLRDRKGDIPILMEHFVGLFAGVMNKAIKRIEPEVMRVLENHPFPGNVRELRNLAEKSVILCDSSTLQVRHLDMVIAPTRPANPEDRSLNLDTLEKEAVTKAMEMAKGNQTKAAALLGLTPKSLERRLVKFGIPTRRA